VEPKTLGWENSMKVLKNVFKNLEVVSTSMKCFQKCSKQRWWIMEEKEWWFLKEKTLVIMYSPGAIKSCNHITPV
jgi:hypothetical protein